jgi:hypothetical protein
MPSKKEVSAEPSIPSVKEARDRAKACAAEQEASKKRALEKAKAEAKRKRYPELLQKACEEIERAIARGECCTEVAIGYTESQWAQTQETEVYKYVGGLLCQALKAKGYDSHVLNGPYSYTARINWDDYDYKN